MRKWQQVGLQREIPLVGAGEQMVEEGVEEDVAGTVDEAEVRRRWRENWTSGLSSLGTSDRTVMGGYEWKRKVGLMR